VLAEADHDSSQQYDATPSAPVLEPAALAFVRERASHPDPLESGAAPAREWLSRIQAGRPVGLGVEREDAIIEGGLVGEVAARIVRPNRPAVALPAIVYVHGGGWVCGDRHTHDALLRKLVLGTGAAIVFPEYSRAPEETYPTALEECYAVARRVAERGRDHGIDGSRIALAGDGAGGNLAAALSLLAKHRGVPRLAGQVLFYPVTNAAFDTVSCREFAHGYHLSREAMERFWDQYIPDLPTRAEPTASPLRADLEQLAGLPTALLITAEADVVRDEGEAYAAKLRAAGVPVTASRYEGAIHDFVVLDALAETNAARGAIAQASGFLSEVLGLV
jgi:acetyl esterase